MRKFPESFSAAELLKENRNNVDKTKRQRVLWFVSDMEMIPGGTQNLRRNHRTSYSKSQQKKMHDTNSSRLKKNETVKITFLIDGIMKAH